MSIGGVSGGPVLPENPYSVPESDDAPAELEGPPAPAPAPVRGSTPDLRKIDLFPRDVLWKVATGESWPPSPAPAPTSPTQPAAMSFSPASGAEATRNRAETLGPMYGALTAPSFGATFDEHLKASAAMSALPAALLAPIAKPAVDKGYALIDHVPQTVRRPFEKAFGLLIDSAMSAPGVAATPLVGSSVTRFHRNGRNLPGSVNLPVQGYSQIRNSCGETAAATILKGAGVPVSLSDVDTQTPGAEGTNLLMEAEMRRRGLTMINGPGDMVQLKSLVAAGYPVMVSVGWEGGGGHYAVVSGYDEASKTLTIENWDGHGGSNKVPYGKFEGDWGRHMNYMTAIIPGQDKRLEPILKAGNVRRPDQIYEGLTLSDFWVNKKGDVFVEGAYRYVGKSTDVTVRVNYNSAEEGLERKLGGSLSLRQRVAPDWYVGLKVEKLSLRGVKDDWTSFKTSPVAAYGTVEGPGFALKAGGERGAFQASVAADLGKVVSGLGASANVAVNEDGSYSVLGGITWTF